MNTEDKLKEEHKTIDSAASALKELHNGLEDLVIKKAVGSFILKHSARIVVAPASASTYNYPGGLAFYMCDLHGVMTQLSGLDCVVADHTNDELILLALFSRICSMGDKYGPKYMENRNQNGTLSSKPYKTHPDYLTPAVEEGTRSDTLSTGEHLAAIVQPRDIGHESTACLLSMDSDLYAVIPDGVRTAIRLHGNPQRAPTGTTNAKTLYHLLICAGAWMR